MENKSGGDFWGTPPFRYLGYSFAFYEAMKDVIRLKPEKTFYVVGVAFIVLHALEHALAGDDSLIIVYELLDTLIYDALASVVLPVLVARVVYDLSTHIVNEMNIHEHVTRFGPPFISLASIILISHPLDVFVNKLMERIIRPLYP